MILLDSIVFNNDRHLNNFSFLGSFTILEMEMENEPGRF